MKITLSFSMFCDAFVNAGRKDQFSYNGLRAIFDHLEEIDPDYDLDVVGVCCDFVEVETWEHARDQYCSGLTGDATEEEVLEYLRDETCVVSESPLVFASF